MINPFAGIGGSVALKGSDGPLIRQKALELGASQLAMQKAEIALKQCIHLQDQIQILTGNEDLGENVAKKMGFEFTCVYQSTNKTTEPEDSIELLKVLNNYSLDILLFAGGDGTARIVADCVKEELPVLGIPAGCKIHSGVFAITPSAAGIVVQKHISGELLSLTQREVRDIDELEFRKGNVQAKHYGYLSVPTDLEYIQAVKMGGKESPELLIDELSDYLSAIMEDYPEHYFVIGSGSTIAKMMERINLENTLLGVDLVYGRESIAQDMTASQLQNLTKDKKVKLVVTVIGGQGHLFGRGNQQLSIEFLKTLDKKDIFIFANKQKILELDQAGLIIDSGDEEFDKTLSGSVPIITGYNDHTLYFIRS